MASTMRWDNPEKTILLFELDDQWTWQELYNLSDEFHALMDSVPHVVDLIFQLPPGSSRVPPGIVAGLPRLIARSHPREGKNIVVGQVPIARSILDLVRRVYGLRQIAEQFHVVDTLEQAYQLIGQREAKG